MFQKQTKKAHPINMGKEFLYILRFLKEAFFLAMLTFVTYT